MQICYQAEMCSGCGLCIVQCPKKCIRMEKNTEGFLYPTVDESLCVGCEKCVRSCPVNHPEQLKNRNETKDCFAFQITDDVILQESSSGGFFSAAALSILAGGGVVYAAEMAELGKVRHVRITREENLSGVRKSKYIQSEAWHVYPEIGTDLKEGRKVLFTGTPCQTAAVKKAYPEADNLFLIDLLCHGVANEEILRRYLESVTGDTGKEVETFRFRHKTGKGGVIIYIRYDDGTEYIANSSKDLFMRGFNSNLFLRRSCYSCKFCGLDRVGDVSIGDFWGLGVLGDTALDQRTGVNFVKINSDKGRQLLQLMREKGGFLMEKHMVSEAKLRNRTLSKPMLLTKERDVFFEKMNTCPFDELVMSLSRDLDRQRRVNDLRDRIIKKIRRVTGKRR